MVPESIPTLTTSILRKRAEAALRASFSDLSQMPEGQIQGLIHELQVHQIQLEMQNEELRDAQVELAESRDRYIDLFDFAPIGYLTLDAEAVIHEANLTAATLLGVPRVALVRGRFNRFIVTDTQDVFHRHRIAVDDCGCRQTCELVLRRGDASTFTAQLETVPIEDTRLYRCAIIDITQRKCAEEAQLEADRRKDEFLAMLAHELRNPLTPISLAAQMLQKRGAQDPNLVKWAGDIVKHQCDNLTHLVNQLLDVSRVTKGKITLIKRRCDLRVLLVRVVESCQPCIDKHRHELILSSLPEEIEAEVDAVRIEQVLCNLIHNAAKYTPDGGKIWLSLQREGDAALICVRDNGIGISTAMLPKVFDLFFQAEHNIDKTREGLGIGLALVKSLVEMHDGSVVARSKGIGFGSEFELRLPLCLRGVRQNEIPKNEAIPSAPFRARRILVVDDNDDVLTSISLLLKTMGHEVREAHGGKEALAIAKSCPLDFILLDIGMPGLNGYEVARRVRKYTELKAVKLIAMTGYDQEYLRRESHRAGFDHHLSKPIDPQELENLLAVFDEA